MNSSQTTSSHNPGGTYSFAGQQVNRIGFGAMQLPGPGVWGPPKNREQAHSVLQQAIALGVNHIDTAAYYGRDVSNTLIHEALHPYPDDLVIVSKVGGARDDEGNWIPAQRPEELRAGVEKNLSTLEIEQVDVVNLRLLDADTNGSSIEEEQQVPLDDQLAEMIALRDEGKIGGIGISTVSLAQLKQALPADIRCVQNAYSVLNRSDESLLTLCTEHDIAWVPFFPLGSAGFPGVESVTDHAEVQQIASDQGCTAAQVGLAWILAHAPNALLIPGTSNPGHLKENMAAGNLELTAQQMEILDGLADQAG